MDKATARKKSPHRDLRERRRRLGWTLMDLAVRTGISPSDLSRVERGLSPLYPGWRIRVLEALESGVESVATRKAKSVENG